MRFFPTFLPAALIVVVAGCKQAPAPEFPGHDPKVAPVAKLISKDTVPGTGDAVEAGDDVWVKYKGTFPDGSVFDENMSDDKQPLHVTVGAGQVIKGWDEGLVGMKMGGKRTLQIPWALAYGANGKKGQEGSPGIPPKTDLTFQVELTEMLKRKDAGTLNASDVPGKLGSGRAAKLGDTVVIDYEAFTGGDSIEQRKDVEVKIGATDMAIADFDKTLVGMKVGGERKVVVPPELVPKGRNERMGMDIVTYDVKMKSIK